MMKNIAFKLSLTLIVFALFCPIVFAENTPNNTPFDINTFSDTINAEDLVYLSYESLKELNVQLLIFAQNHNYDENAIDNQLKVLLNHYKKSEIEILNESQRYVDLGFCKRVDQRSGDVNPKLYPTDTSEKR